MGIARGVVACVAGVTALGVASLSAQAPQPMPPSALPIRLIGVMVDTAEPSRSTCLIECTSPADQRRTAILELGQPACALADIREVRADAIVIMNLAANRLERLTLQSGSDAPGAPAPAESPSPAPTVVRTSPGLVIVEMPKASVAQYLTNLPDLLSSALATPHYADTGSGRQVMDGFQLSQIRESSVADRVGLKNGDVIVEVNSEKLDSMAMVLKLFGQAQTMAQVKLTVMRDGQPLTVVINTK